MCQLASVTFHQDTLYLVQHNNEPYTPMKSIVESMGLDWMGQFSKLKNKWKTCIEEISIQLPNDNQKRKYTCLPIRKLHGWLYSISPNKCKPEIRAKIIQYQNECDDVLWKHWTGQDQKTIEQKISLLPNFPQGKLVAEHFNANTRKVLFNQTRNYLYALHNHNDGIDVSGVIAVMEAQQETMVRYWTRLLELKNKINFTELYNIDVK
jgi:hypothetical protein